MTTARGGVAALLMVVLGVGASCQGATNPSVGNYAADVPGEAPPAPPSSPPVTTPPGPSAVRHATDFLTAGCRTHLYGSFDSAGREYCRNRMKDRGYTHIYVYAYNELDYGGPSFDFFADPSRFRQLLSELNDAGLEPVVWLFPDDAPRLAAMSAGTIQSMLERFIPAVHDLVGSFVLGIELDEYWQSAKVDSLGTRLAQLTPKPIAVHQLPGRWQYCAFSWCDYMILQYGFDRTPSDIEGITRDAIASIRKPVVAGEYELVDEGRAVGLGNVAVAAGASGFGNGGPRSASGSAVRADATGGWR